MKQLIAFFSRAGNNYRNGQIINLAIGNTEIAAKQIQDMIGAELFKIEPQKKYSDDYSECINEAKADQWQNIRPELENSLESVEEYDTIYLGYPNYWGTMPMAVFTFLEQFDFKGKRIRPFCTHEGSGVGSSIEDIRKLCCGAVVEKALAIHGADVSRSEDVIREWLQQEP